MGPTLHDSSSDECRKILRRMELETYGAVVSTLRAQGELNKDRRKLLQDLSAILQISPERHKAEVRRAVNDEKLAHIANRVSGAADTEWEWALEGRRIIPLMPRLLHPTPLTSLATTVSKAITQNPRICLDHIPSRERADDVPSKYVRDPDDEDTLSPVMVPVASPESSCHSNNNVELDFSDPVSEKVLSNFDVQKTLNKPIKGTSVVNTGTPPVKRSRSPSTQVVNAATPVTKVRAISPSCVRLQQQRVVGLQPNQSGPKGLMITQTRPGLQLQNPSVPGKIRVRAPVDSTGSLSQRLTTSKQSVPQCAQSNHTPRPQLNSGVKQVVQIRTAPLQSQMPLAIQTKESNNITPSQPAINVASTLPKSLPGKANVIVLHKNSVAARNITASRDGERAVVTKTNFLSKSVSSPMATKMTFPGNVRIITVPSGGTVQSTTTNSSSNTGIPRVISSITPSTSSLGQHQKNVFVLELSNDELSKSIVLSDFVPATNINGNIGVTMTGAGGNRPPAQFSAVNAKDSIGEQEVRTEVISFEDAVNNGLDESSTNIASNIQNYEFCLSSGEGVKGNQNAVVVQRLPHIQEQVVNTVDNVQMEENAVHGILDPQTGLFYASTGTTRVNERSQLDIFSTAIASADISLDTNSLKDENGSTRLILTDIFDSPSTKSSSLKME